MRPTDKNYAGIDGFVWWMGIVESRKDPLNLGRCQVRIFGWHSSSLTDIPTEDLPWAHPIYPLNNNNFGTPRESEMVFGFFADGRNGQVPIMLGVMPTIPAEESQAEVGFGDNRTEQEITGAPKRIQNITYKTDGEGAQVVEGQPQRYPLPGKPTLSGLSRNDLEGGYPIKSRKDRGSVKIPTIRNGNVSTPTPSYNPVYPYNQVVESESGHSLELDDSPGAERVELNHRSGTYFEIQPDGSKIEEIVRKNYRVVMSDDHVYIMGNAIVTVDSATRVRAKGDLTVEAGNNLNLKVAGNMNMTVSGDLAIKAKNIKMESDVSSSIKSGVAMNIESDTTSIRGNNGINNTSGSGINLRAPTINTLGALNYGTFSTKVADFAPPAGLTELLPVAIKPEVLLNDIGAVSASQLQSTLLEADSAILDGVMQGIDANKLSEMISSTGDTFSALDLVDKLSSVGAAGMIESIDVSGATNLLGKLQEFGDGSLNQLVDKIPLEKIQDLTSKLDVDQLSSLITDSVGENLNKVVEGMSDFQIKDIVSSGDFSNIRKIIEEGSDAALIKIKGILNSSEITQIKNNISEDLKVRFEKIIKMN